MPKGPLNAKAMTKQNLFSMLFGFLGALLFYVLKDPTLSMASSPVIVGSAFNLVDSNGRLRAQLAFSKEGPPAFWLMDEQGRARVVHGLYPDGTGFMGLQDAKGQMIELLRSFGADEAPLLIFKHSGQDMMITGLNPGDVSTPFLLSYQKDRSKKIHFGTYAGP